MVISKLSVVLLLLVAVDAKKTIAVIGATGMQGGALVDAILEDGEFACRAVTRNPTSAKAVALKNRGCEVVRADISDIESLEKAFDGAYGAFLLTNFWEHFDVQKEAQQSIDLVEAALRNGVEHCVLSTLEPVMSHDETQNLLPWLGDYKVPHFDGKAQATRYLKSKMYPITYFYTSFYMENFWFFKLLSRGDDDSHYKVVLPLDGKKFNLISTRDIGIGALQAFKNKEQFVNQDHKVLSEMLTVAEVAEKIAAVAGITVDAYEPPAAEFAKYGFPGAEDLANMFSYFSNYHDVWATYHRVPNGDTFDGFLARESSTLKNYISETNAAAKKQEL